MIAKQATVGKSLRPPAGTGLYCWALEATGDALANTTNGGSRNYVFQCTSQVAPCAAQP